jgi:FAD:protein FMN transferase
MATATLAIHAMATRFELVLYGDNASALRAVGGEALAEIRRLEAQLSPFVPTSEIAHLNARAGREPVRVTPTLFALLQHAQRLTSETGGAFDITIGPLMRCWGFRGGGGRLPAARELADAKAKVGMHLVQLDPKELTVRFEREGVMLDLGAIGKGYAVEQAVEVLREGRVTSALLHGGTSTLYGLGVPPGAESWLVALDHPGNPSDPMPVSDPGQAADSVPAACSILTMHDRKERDRQGGEAKPLATISLRDESLSLSGIWGRFFRAQGRILGHIVDPRTGEPANRSILAAVVLPSATETDALSTALLTLGPEGHDRIVRLRAGMRTLVVSHSGGRLESEARGIAIEAPD